MLTPGYLNKTRNFLLNSFYVCSIMVISQFFTLLVMNLDLINYHFMPAEAYDELQNEQEERREYVKNIGIEYRFGCYQVKDF